MLAFVGARNMGLPVHTDTPTGGIKVLAGRANGNGELLNFRGQSRDSGERDVEQAVIHLIGENNDLMLHTQVTNLLQLLLGEDLSNRVIYSY